MLNKKDFETKLKAIPAPLVVATATRCALRSLPFLAAARDEKEVFSLWKDETKALHLLNVFRGLNFGCAVALGVEVAGDHKNAYLSASMPTNDGLTDAFVKIREGGRAGSANEQRAMAMASMRTQGYAAACATYAAGSGKEISDPTLISDCYSTAHASVVAAGKQPFMQAAIAHDLDMATLSPSVESLLNSPLWPDKNGRGVVESLWQNFKASAVSFDCGFEEWLGWFEDRLLARDVYLAFLQGVLAIPDAVFGQGPKAFNEQVILLRAGQCKETVATDESKEEAVEVEAAS